MNTTKTSVGALLSITLVTCGACASDGPGEGGATTALPRTPHLENGSSYESSLCGGARWSAPDEVVAAGFSNLDLVLMTADGQLRKAYSFARRDGHRLEDYATHVDAADGRITATLIVEPGHVGGVPRAETVRLDSRGRLLWRLPGVASVASDSGMGGPLEGVTQLQKADGTVVPLPIANAPSIELLQGPDDDGWVVARWWTETTHTSVHEGLVNLDGRRFRELATVPATLSLSSSRVSGKYLYLVQSSEHAWRLDLQTAETSRSFQLETAHLDPTTQLSLAASGSFGMVTDGRDRLWRIDGDRERVELIDETHVAHLRAGHEHVDVWSSMGEWYLGTSSAVPIWRFQARRRLLEAVPLTTFGTLRPLEGHFCNPAMILPDGRIGLGLRTDEAAGFYLSSPDLQRWERVGEALRDITGVSARRVADTWVVQARSGVQSYCPPFEPFTGEPSGRVFAGDTVQIVAPGSRPLVLQAERGHAIGTVRMDPTGMCAFHQDPNDRASRIHDLAKGTSQEVAHLASFTWLGETTEAFTP